MYYRYCKDGKTEILDKKREAGCSKGFSLP